MKNNNKPDDITSLNIVSLGTLQFKTILTIIFVFFSTSIIQVSMDYGVISKIAGKISLPLMLILSIYYINKEFSKYRESGKKILEDVAEKFKHLEQNGEQNGKI